nr:hypothetical protein Q903MT_gene6450 [Picea sitchensis]
MARHVCVARESFGYHVRQGARRTNTTTMCNDYHSEQLFAVGIILGGGSSGQNSYLGF